MCTFASWAERGVMEFVVLEIIFDRYFWMKKWMVLNEKGYKVNFLIHRGDSYVPPFMFP